MPAAQPFLHERFRVTAACFSQELNADEKVVVLRASPGVSPFAVTGHGHRHYLFPDDLGGKTRIAEFIWVFYDMIVLCFGGTL